MQNFNELRFLCCDIFYLLELTLKTQVSNTMNTVGISSNDKYLLLLLLQHWCSKCPPSARKQARRRVRHWFTAAEMMLWCKSHHSSISHSFLSGRHASATGPGSHSRLDWGPDYSEATAMARWNPAFHGSTSQQFHGHGDGQEHCPAGMWRIRLIRYGWQCWRRQFSTIFL